MSTTPTNPATEISLTPAPRTSNGEILYSVRLADAYAAKNKELEYTVAKEQQYTYAIRALLTAVELDQSNTDSPIGVQETCAYIQQLIHKRQQQLATTTTSPTTATSSTSSTSFTSSTSTATSSVISTASTASTASTSAASATSVASDEPIDYKALCETHEKTIASLRTQCSNAKRVAKENAATANTKCIAADKAEYLQRLAEFKSKSRKERESSMRAEMNRLKTELRHAQERIAKPQVPQDVPLYELTDLNRGLQNAIPALEEQILSARLELEDSRRENGKLVQQNTSLTKLLDESNGAYIWVEEDRNQALATQVDANKYLSKKLCNMKATLAATEERLASKNTENEQLNNDLTSSRAAVAQLQTDLTSANTLTATNIAKLEQQACELQANKGTILALNLELTSARNSLATKTTELTGARHELALSESANTNLFADVQAKGTITANLMMETDKVRTKLDKCSDENTQLRIELRVAEESLGEKEDQVQGLFRDMNATREAAATDKKALEDEVALKEEDLKLAKSEITQTTNDFEGKLADKNNQMERLVEKHKGGNQLLFTRIRRRDDKIRELKSEISSLERSNHTTTKMLQDETERANAATGRVKNSVPESFSRKVTEKMSIMESDLNIYKKKAKLVKETIQDNQDLTARIKELETILASMTAQQVQFEVEKRDLQSDLAASEAWAKDLFSTNRPKQIGFGSRPAATPTSSSITAPAPTIYRGTVATIDQTQALLGRRTALNDEILGKQFAAQFGGRYTHIKRRTHRDALKPRARGVAK